MFQEFAVNKPEMPANLLSQPALGSVSKELGIVPWDRSFAPEQKAKDDVLSYSEPLRHSAKPINRV